MGVPVLSPAVAGSRVLQTLDTVTPAPTRSLLAQLRTAALGEGIPWLIDVLEPSGSTIRSLMRLNLPAGVDIEIKL